MFKIRKMPVKISLTELEWEIVKLLAADRNSKARAIGYYRDPGNRNDPDEIEIRGVAAELAFCKFINVYPARTLNRVIDRDPDLILNGKTVDIKGTGAVENDLMVSMEVNHKHDIYVVLAVIRPDAFYLGYSLGEILFKEDQIYYPAPKNGNKRTPFYRVLNRELKNDDFWNGG